MKNKISENISNLLQLKRDFINLQAPELIIKSILHETYLLREYKDSLFIHGISNKHKSLDFMLVILSKKDKNAETNTRKPYGQRQV